MSALPGSRRSTPSVVASIDVVPPSLLEELATALGVADELADSELHFVAAPRRRLRFEVTGPDGDRRVLTGAEALELAAGM